MTQLEHIKIAIADVTDNSALTEIAFAAKRYWNYPENYYKLWHDELTITTDYIDKNIVYKTMLNNSIIGFYSIVENNSDCYAGEVFVQKGFWLEHIFIMPDYHRLGIGRMMIEHVKQTSRASGIHNLMIFVDPFARGFYDKIGAQFMYESKSSISGRFIPIYDLKIQ